MYGAAGAETVPAVSLVTALRSVAPRRFPSQLWAIAAYAQLHASIDGLEINAPEITEILPDERSLSLTHTVLLPGEHDRIRLEIGRLFLKHKLAVPLITIAEGTDLTFTVGLLSLRNNTHVLSLGRKFLNRVSEEHLRLIIEHEILHERLGHYHKDQLKKLSLILGAATTLITGTGFVSYVLRRGDFFRVIVESSLISAAILSGMLVYEATERLVEWYRERCEYEVDRTFVTENPDKKTLYIAGYKDALLFEEEWRREEIVSYTSKWRILAGLIDSPSVKLSQKVRTQLVLALERSAEPQRLSLMSKEEIGERIERLLRLSDNTN